MAVSHTAARRWLASLCAVALTWATACDAPAEDAAEPGTDVAELTRTGDTYDIPDPLPDADPGTLLALRDDGSVAELDGAHRWTVLYLSRNSRDEPVAVSGVVLVPDGAPPSGGWPVVSWGHGTTGVADRCAPSIGQHPDPAERSLLDAGYAVVATDYMGRGTPGTHTYMNEVDQGRALAHIVPAARDAVSELSGEWFAVGHSQGGAAALSATRASEQDGIDTLRATVALAPGNSLDAAVEPLLSGTDPAPVRAVFGLYVLIGLAESDPNFTVDTVLGPAGAQAVETVRDTCLSDAAAADVRVDPADVFEVDGVDVDQLGALLAEYGNPDKAPVRGPVLVVQGDADRLVPAAGTEAMIARLRSLGSDVTELILPGLGHGEIVPAAACDVLTFLAEHGGTPVDC